MHVRDAQERPDIYKVNALTIDQMKINLMVLFARDDEVNNEGHVLFHTEDEIMDLLKPSDQTEKQRNEGEEKDVYNIQDPIAVYWDSMKSREWYVGFYIGKKVMVRYE